MLGLFGNDVARRFEHDQQLVHSEVTDMHVSSSSYDMHVSSSSYDQQLVHSEVTDIFRFAL